MGMIMAVSLRLVNLIFDRFLDWLTLLAGQRRLHRGDGAVPVTATGVLLG